MIYLALGTENIIFCSILLKNIQNIFIFLSGQFLGPDIFLLKEISNKIGTSQKFKL